MPDYLTRVDLTIGGIARYATQVTAALSAASGIASCNVTIDRSQGDVTPGDPIALRMGLNGQVDWVFTGEIEDEGVDFYPTQIAVSGVGNLYKARKKTNKVDLSYGPSTPDPDAPAPEKIAYWSINRSDQDTVKDLLELAGITVYDIEGTGLPLTTINPVTLRTGGNPWSLIQEIDKRTWYRTFDGPDGTIIRRPYTVTPAGSASFTLREGIDLYQGQRSRTRSGMVTNVHVKGITIPTNDYPIVIDFATNAPETNAYGINDVEEWQSDLFESQEAAQTWATTALGEYGKLQEKLTFTLGKGDTRIVPGVTVAIVSAQYGFGALSRFLVESVRHYTDGVSYMTSAVFRGSATPTGGSLNQKPIAMISITRIDREYLEDGSTIDIVALDASASYDPDGVVALYAWSGVPAMPAPIGDGKRATVAYVGGIPAGATVTIVVTDGSGLTGTKTIPVVASAGVPIQLRPLWAAVGTELLFSLGGKGGWDSVAIPATGVVHEAAPLYTLAWTAAGELYKVLRDKTFTLLTPTDVTAAYIAYGADGAFTGVCYAATNAGQVWRSVDSGASWTAIGGMAAPTGIATMISESPYQGGQLQMTVRNALLRSYDAGASFELQREHSNADVLATSFAAGFDLGFVGFSGPGDGAGFVQERDNKKTIALSSGDVPVQVRVLTIGAEVPILWILGVDKNGIAVVYQFDTGTSDLAKKAWTAAHGLPNDAIRDGSVEGLVYFAADSVIGKSVDGFTTTLAIKSLTGAQQGRKIGYGPWELLPPIKGAVLWIAGTRNGDTGQYTGMVVNSLDDTGLHRVCAASAFPMPAGNHVPLLRVSGAILLAYSINAGQDATPTGAANALRSPDGGATWVATTLSYVNSMTTDGAGNVYALCWADDGTQTGANAGLYRSIDAGLSWTFCARLDGTSNSGPRSSHVTMSPTNPLHVMVRLTYGRDQASAYSLSTDGGLNAAPVIAVNEYAAVYRGHIGSYTPDGAHFLHKDSFADETDLILSLATGPRGGSTLAAAESRATVGFMLKDDAIYIYGNFGARYSPDNGATWRVGFGDAQAIAFVAGDASNGWAAFTINGLYTHAAGAAPEGFGAWDAVSNAALVAAFPDGVYVATPAGAILLIGTGA